MFHTDAFSGCTNAALQKFSNYPSLFSEPKSMPFTYSVLPYKNKYQFVDFVFSL